MKNNLQNEIEATRKDIKQFFNPKAIVEEADTFGLSPQGTYHYETALYQQTDKARNWIVSKVNVRHTDTEELVYEYFTDNDQTFASWLVKDNNYYLFLPEAQGGQSILDIAGKKLHSFFSKQDAFIWTHIVASPDGTRLAVAGCYWACPYQVAVYDCSHLLALPYPCLHTLDLPEDFNLVGWRDNNTIVLQNTKEEEQLITLG